MHAVHRFEKYRPWLLLAAFAFALCMLVLPGVWRLTTRLIVSWDVGIGLYLLIALWMARRFNLENARRRAALLDENQWQILFLIIAAVIASVAAIVAELASAKSQSSHISWQLVALTGLTVVLSWSFLHMSFAFHYAHEYYGDGMDKALGGLQFPDEKHPDYWDFIYFSYVIGAAAQTADVNISSKAIRKFATVHCILSFFFNTVILGLTVNISASLF